MVADKDDEVVTYVNSAAGFRRLRIEKSVECQIYITNTDR
jgi:hypothetical protein